MDLFISLSLLIAIVLIFLCVYRDRMVNASAFRKALTNFIIAVIAHNPAIDVFAMIPPGFVWTVALRVIAYIFLLLSFRQLCLAFGAPLGERSQLLSKVGELARRDDSQAASAPPPKL